MRKICGLVAGVAASAFASAAAACDVDYVIQEGDTLPAIAEAAYGASNYQLIFARNFGVLTSPSSLPVGSTIVIPCIVGDGGVTPDADALAERQASITSPAPEPEPAPEAAVATEEDAAPEPLADAEPAPQPAAQTPARRAGGLRLLTANDQPPYADESLRGGGMVTELVRLSLANTGFDDRYKIVYVDDRDSHVEDLLIEGSFDAGFPWLRPRCDEIETLREIAPDQALICERFEFSEPFYEYVNGFFVREGEFSASRTNFDDFSGGSICRPAGRSVMDLAVNGLAGEEVELVRPASVGDCFALLMTEEVDAVSVEIFEAEDVMASEDLFEQVEELPSLSLLWTVHAISAKGKPGAAEAMAALNEGLLDLKISGRWFRVVARHLAAQNGG